MNMDQSEDSESKFKIRPFRQFEVNSKGDNTDYHFDFDQSLPEEFHFDTLLIKKANKKAEYRAYYLQSTDPRKKNFNRLMLNTIALNIESDADYVDSNDPEDVMAPLYTYELGPFEFFMNNDVISMCYVVDSYTEGGNHHNYSWYTFNYDIERGNVLRLEDVFVLNTAEDSAALLKDVRVNIEQGSTCGELFEPFEYMDFSFVREGIVMNPYLSWACGMRRSLLAKDQEFQSVKEEWR